MLCRQTLSKVENCSIDWLKTKTNAITMAILKKKKKWFTVNPAGKLSWQLSH